MSKYQKTVEYIENNKKKIVIGAVGAVALIGGIVCVAMGKKPNVPVKFSGVFETPSAKDIPIADWSVGTLTDCWHEGGWINAIAKDFTVADAGKLGEELLKIDGVAMDTAMQVVMSVPDTQAN